MRDRIHIQLVTTEAEYLEARDFLRTFAHELLPGHRPIRIVRRGSKIIAVTQIITAPMHLMSWSTDPAVCSPRDIVDGCNAIRMMEEGYSEIGAAYALVAEHSPFNDGSVMEGLGFTDSKLRLFTSQNTFPPRRLEKPDSNAGGST